MLYINRENLNSNSKMFSILEVVDGVVTNYIKSIDHKEAISLETISTELQSLNTALFKSFMPKGVSNNYNAFFCVSLKTFFSIEEYLNTIAPELEEYKLLESILNLADFFWLNPIKSLQSKTAIFDLQDKIEQWLLSQNLNGDLTLAKTVCQSMYLSLTTIKLVIPDLNILIKSFIPNNMQVEIVGGLQKIENKYLKIMSALREKKTIKPTSSDVDIPHCLDSYFKQAIDVKQKNNLSLKNIIQNFKIFKNKIKTLNAADNSNKFWDSFETKTQLNEFIELINLDKKEQKKWLKNLNIKKRTKKKWLISIDSIKQYINIAAENFCIKNFKIDNIISKTTDPFEKFELLTKKEEQSNLSTQLLNTQQQANNICKLIEPPLKVNDNFNLSIMNDVENITRSDNPSFEKQKYICNNTLKILNNLLVQFNNQNMQFSRFNKNISDVKKLLTSQNQPKLFATFKKDLNKQYHKLQKQLLPIDNNIKTISSKKIINNIISYNENICQEINIAINRVNDIINNKDDKKIKDALYELKQHLESDEHHNLWAWLLRCISPSYNKCLELCLNSFHDNTLSQTNSNKDCVNKLRHDLSQISINSSWWDLGQNRSENLSCWFGKYQFFTPLENITSSEYSEINEELAENEIFLM